MTLSDDRAADATVRGRNMRELLLITDRMHKALWQAVAEQVMAEQLSVVQWLILSDIENKESGTLTDYALLLDRDPGSLSRVIHSLTMRGLLQGRRASGDRRSVLLAITDNGAALCARVGPRLDSLASVLEEEFGQLSLNEVVRRMTRAEACIRRRSGTPSPKLMVQFTGTV